jgi:hypothetical protein
MKILFLSFFGLYPRCVRSSQFRKLETQAVFFTSSIIPWFRHGYLIVFPPGGVNGTPAASVLYGFTALFVASCNLRRRLFRSQGTIPQLPRAARWFRSGEPTQDVSGRVSHAWKPPRRRAGKPTLHRAIGAPPATRGRVAKREARQARS